MKPTELTVLAIGDEVFCLLDQKAGKQRSVLLGAARARVARVDANVSLVILHASPNYYEGREIEKPRLHVYAVHNRAEHRAFGELLTKFWGAPL